MTLPLPLVLSLLDGANVVVALHPDDWAERWAALCLRCGGTGRAGQAPAGWANVAGMAYITDPEVPRGVARVRVLP
jgi:hypothetical protein